MESALPIIVQVITGVVGGQAVGAALKTAAMGQLPKLLSGGIGGLAGGTILGSLLGGATGADPTSSGAMGGCHALLENDQKSRCPVDFEEDPTKAKQQLGTMPR